MFSRVLIFTAIFLFSGWKKDHVLGNIMKTPCTSFRGFEETSTMAKTNLLRTTPNVKCMVSKNTTLEV